MKKLHSDTVSESESDLEFGPLETPSSSHVSYAEEDVLLMKTLVK